MDLRYSHGWPWVVVVTQAAVHELVQMFNMCTMSPAELLEYDRIVTAGTQ